MAMIVKIKKDNITESVLDQMKNCIMRGEWKPGDKIPSESQLIDMFGISRVSVRAAIHRLLGMGVLTVKRGDGTYVSNVGPIEYTDTLLPMLMIENPDLLEILEFRLMLETSYVFFTVERVTDKDLEYLEKTLQGMRDACGQNDYETFSKCDLNFHLCLAIATHNRVIQRVFHIINDIMSHSMRDIVNIVGLEDGIHYHEKIIEAIKAHDAKQASRHMRDHMENAIRKVRRTIA